MGRDMELIVENMLKSTNKNTRSRTANAKRNDIIHCDNQKICSPKGELWNCFMCKFDLAEEEECFKCHGCDKIYHIMCRSDAATLCIRVTGAKTKEPQLSFNHDQDVTARSISMGGASGQGLATSTPAGSREGEDRVSDVSSEISSLKFPKDCLLYTSPSPRDS